MSQSPYNGLSLPAPVRVAIIKEAAVTTQEHMGRFSLLKRLTAQIGGDEAVAKKILIQRGHIREDGTLTPEGFARDRMTAEERAKDRAVKLSKGGKVKDYVYNPATNRARLRNR